MLASVKEKFQEIATKTKSMDERIDSLEDTNKVLASGASYMNAAQTWTLSEPISEQPHGIVLAWSRYTDGTAYDDTWNYFFIPKHAAIEHSGNGVALHLINSVGTAPSYKYLYISNTKIVGNDVNSKGTTSSADINWLNNYFVLRYVIGV